jgi:DNA-binding GntR family transcriptional regulator
MNAASATAPLSGWTEEGIYQRMVQTIRDHQLHPGTKLGEDRLASAFGVSRTRIRPVLARLAGEQVVTLTPNRGATVARPTEQEAREVFQVRRLVEPTLVAAFMQRASGTDFERLSHCIAQEDAARVQGERHRAIRLAGAFHLHIAELSQHQTLGRIMGELVSRTSLVLMAYGPSATPVGDPALGVCACHGHRALLDAMRLGDCALAEQLMREHLHSLEAELCFMPPRTEAPDLLALFRSTYATTAAD